MCSDGGVGSVSFLVQETVVGEVSCRLPRMTPQWSVRHARHLQNQAGSVDITKDAILFSVCRCRSVYVCRGVSVVHFCTRTKTDTTSVPRKRGFKNKSVVQLGGGVAKKKVLFIFLNNGSSPRLLWIRKLVI